MVDARRRAGLNADPSIEVASIGQIFAVAIAMEEEAAARYRDLAERMRLQGVRDLESLFRFLADIEEKHAGQVRSRSAAHVTRVDKIDGVHWELPEKFEEQEGRSYVLTPYSALAIAVRNEDRAFAFYSYLAAHAPSPDIRVAAEELARDELDHASLLRRERRKAWRTQPIEAPQAIPADLVSFLARVATVEQTSARGHRSLSDRLSAEGHAFEARLFAEVAEEEEKCAREAKAGDTASPGGKLPPAETVRDGLRLLESAFNQYAEIAEQAGDEAVMRTAQDYEARALRRLSFVQGALGNPLLGHRASEE
ncbi:MAG: hypothetical protein JSS04_12895 [Proteobacteria bacterium]|nr:hypothetical protein [Pseudomonadota bacterium]